MFITHVSTITKKSIKNQSTEKQKGQIQHNSVKKGKSMNRSNLPYSHPIFFSDTPSWRIIALIGRKNTCLEDT